MLVPVEHKTEKHGKQVFLQNTQLRIFVQLVFSLFDILRTQFTLEPHFRLLLLTFVRNTW